MARVVDLGARNCLGIVRSKYRLKAANSIVREIYPRSDQQRRLSIRRSKFQRQFGINNKCGASK